jgi:hypothetical protein
MSIQISEPFLSVPLGIVVEMGSSAVEILVSKYTNIRDVRGTVFKLKFRQRHCAPLRYWSRITSISAAFMPLFSGTISDLGLCTNEMPVLKSDQFVRIDGTVVRHGEGTINISTETDGTLHAQGCNDVASWIVHRAIALYARCHPIICPYHVCASSLQHHVIC